MTSRVIAQLVMRGAAEFDRRRSRPRSQNAVEDASGVSAVFGPISSVDLVVDVVVGVDECDVLLNTAGPYPTFVPLLGTTEPMGFAPSYGSDVHVVAVTDDPHGHRFTQRAVAPDRRDLHFFRPSDLVELVPVIGPSPSPYPQENLIARRAAIAL